MGGAKGHRIETCTYCNEDYCRTCSTAEYPDDYCSQECQDAEYADAKEQQANDD